MKQFFLIAITALMASTLASCQKSSKYEGSCKLTNEEDSLSYILGMYEAATIENNLYRSPLDTFDAKPLASVFAISQPRKEYVEMCQTQFECFSAESFMYGFTHQLSQKTQLVLENEVMRLNEKVSEIRAKKDTLRAQQARENKARSQKFLDENAKQPGVVTLASGLQYKVLTKGTGPKPTLSDRVKVHYTGSLIDGTVFDSSVQRGEPIVFGLTGVIKGWTEILQLMPAGSKWTVYIPSDLGYGDIGSGEAIPGGSALIFDIELIEIVK